jgi:hypothetical protein
MYIFTYICIPLLRIPHDAACRCGAALTLEHVRSDSCRASAGLVRLRHDTIVASLRAELQLTIKASWHGDSAPGHGANSTYRAKYAMDGVSAYAST